MNDLPNRPDSSVNDSLLPPPPPSKYRRWIIGGLLILAGSGFYFFGTREETTPVPDLTSTVGSTSRSPLVSKSTDLPSSTTTSQAPVTSPASAKLPSRTVLESGGLQLAAKSSYSCTAQAPADWSMTSTAQSNTADLSAPDNSMYAGYGIQAVNTALAGYAGYYAAPLNDPDLYSSDPATVTLAYGRILVSGLGGSSDLHFTAETDQTLGDYRLRTVASSTHKGAIFYHTTGFPGDGYNYSYAEPMYFAFTSAALWPTEGLLVVQIASSIRCSTQYQPRDQYVSTGSSSSTKADENGDEAGYNPELGTEYVHDSGTGENYLVSPSTNWSNDGPEGAGYYKPNGNDFIKLEPGRSD